MRSKHTFSPVVVGSLTWLRQQEQRGRKKSTRQPVMPAQRRAYLLEFQKWSVERHIGRGNCPFETACCWFDYENANSSSIDAYDRRMAYLDSLVEKS